MLLKQLRQADPRNRIPVHLLLEEAHRYIADSPSSYAVDANRIFERVAKEGRKYGLFLLVASQRPSELSRTVLSQCSNFIVHRIQNPDDLSQIRQMTPFISNSVLQRLPSLPKQHALVFGTSVNLPTTFKVRDAIPLPASDDAKIRELSFHELGRLAGLRLDDPLLRYVYMCWPLQRPLLSRLKVVVVIPLCTANLLNCGRD
jgi:DNA helicase HerA-like ATPase